MQRDFTSWLLAQGYRKDLVGELSDLANWHKGWPITDNEQVFRVFFHQQKATDSVKCAFQLAYNEWKSSGHLPPINVLQVKNLSLYLS